MKCPHCGHYIPEAVQQAALQFPETIRPRWPHGDAFASLLVALKGNVIDATLLCLLMEDQQCGNESSYRSLSDRSAGLFKKSMVQQSVQRLTEAGFVVPQENQPRYIDLDKVRRAAVIAYPTIDDRLLWMMALFDGNFRHAMTLYLMFRHGGLQPQWLEAVRIVREFKELLQIPVFLNSVKKSFSTIMSNKYLVGIDKNEFRWQIINASKINHDLAIVAANWVAAGSVTEPWVAGLGFAVTTYQQPFQCAQLVTA
jgi:hypothetical protein